MINFYANDIIISEEIISVNNVFIGGEKMIKTLDELLEMAQKKQKKTLSVAVAQDKEVLTAVTEAVNLGIVNAILVGDQEKIIKIAEENNLDISKARIIDEKNMAKAAAKAVEMVSKGEANYLMKGLLGTADILRAVLNKEAGLRGKGLLSHVMIYSVPKYHKLLFLTDGGMVPYPTLEEKIGILNNALDVAHSLGIDTPKVAPICAVEVVNPGMQATLDASVLTQMSKR